MELSASQQTYEIRQEFLLESQAYARHRSPIEDTQALNHINALLDAYLEISIDLAWEQHATGTQ